MNSKKPIVVVAMLFLGLSIFAGTLAVAYAPVPPPPISPPTITATLNPGESISEGKTVFLPGVIPKGDVLFSFDLTGSMWDDIDVVKAQAIDLMNNLTTLITDAQFGVVSFMDYPHTYDSYGYYATYGDASYGDYAYRLDQPITSNTTLVSNAINSLVTGSGWDWPQDYARIMNESYSDPAIGWRPGAKHILIILGDAVPHDDNLNEGIYNWTWSTGGDPGRDEVMFTGDDIDLQTALQDMKTNGITLLFVVCTGGWYKDYWDYWTGITGGYAYNISDASDIPTAIQSMVEAMAGHIHVLTLKAEAGYEAWLTSVVPQNYTEFDIPPGGVTKTFTITITVPPGTIPGPYIFHIIADADGANYGEQTVTITVPPEFVIPEYPIGTIMGLLACFVALAVFAGSKRYKLPHSSTKI